MLIGGNDAVLAAYSVGVRDPGEIINVNGTCEISLVCLPRCLPSPNYNIRAHVLPDRWLTLHVMNAGGKALEWFKSVFCSEMTDEEFYNDFLPRAVDAWLDRDSGVTYVPYLMGSRYSLEPLKAELLGLTQTTTREEILAAIVRGLCQYQKQPPPRDRAPRPAARHDPPHRRRRQPRPDPRQTKVDAPARYVHEQDSSAKGAALLARLHLQNL